MSITSLYELFRQSTGVSTDTRSIQPGNLFFALKGPHFNANKLADDAIAKGAIAAVIDEVDFQKGPKYVVVNDGLEALQQLALHHRRQFSIPFIGITGSNGKTTTKELIAGVLKMKYKIHFTQGNLNNHIGVPLTLLSMPLDTEIAIIEMGANKIGDIAELCAIAEPDHGMITNIGKAHLEGFGSLEGVARGKSELYVHLLKSGGKVFVNAHDEHLMRMSSRLPERILYPGAADYFHSEYIASDPFVRLQVGEHEVQTQLIGKYNYYNIAAALCIGKFFGVSDADARQAVAAYNPTNNRSQVIRHNGITIIMDAYNANPSSMREALLNMEEMQADKKMIIVGDMFELGNDSVHEHQSIGELALECHFTKSLFVGKYMLHAHKQVPMSLYFGTVEEAKAYLEGEELAGWLVLIKGSRGMKLEQLTDVL